MSDNTLDGACLCGAVRFALQPPVRLMVHCHCSRCRKSTGTGHATNFNVDPGQFQWLSGEDSISRFDLPGARSSGKWFCRHCGSPLPRLAPGEAVFEAGRRQPSRWRLRAVRSCGLARYICRNRCR